MKSKRLCGVLVIGLFACTQIQARVLYETDFTGDAALTDWVTTDNFWTHDPLAGTLAVSGAPAASAAYYGGLDLTDYTVTAEVEVNNSATAVVARFSSLTNPFYMCRYHPQNAVLQLYLINTTTLLGSLTLAEMPELDPSLPYTISITVMGDAITGSLSQGSAEYSVQAMDQTVTHGFGGMRIYGGGDNVFTHFSISDNINITARNPRPANAQTDVLRDVTLSWTPGESASTHDVYLSPSFDEITGADRENPGPGQLAQGQDANSIGTGRLALGTPYYWRVDEVNGAPDYTVIPGEIWNFTIEPYSIQIPGSMISISASSYTKDNDPNALINGSGLTGSSHNAEDGTGWLSLPTDLKPALEFEFTRAQLLDKITIWNSNTSVESFIGMGAREIILETSLDGDTWTGVDGVNLLTRAPGVDGYDSPDTLALDGIVATQIRLQILNNWGGMPVASGLSEVQFYAIPTYARTPAPASGSMVLPDSRVSWRAGRQADQHTLYLSSDLNAVTDGTATSVSSSTNSLDLGVFDLALDATYYWRVDEVNAAAVPPAWPGSVWHLMTPDSLIVDDFEDYTNFSPDRPFQTWLDGFGYSEDEFFPVAYSGNGTGAGIGHDIWSPGSPYFDGQIMEGTLVKHGNLSMPFYYNNQGSIASQIDRTWAVPQDWQAHGIKTLSLSVYGDQNNTGQLYLKLNHNKVMAERINIAASQWQAWVIDLSTVGTDLANILTLSIGIEGSGASGKLYIDDIRLYPTGVPGGFDSGSAGTMLNNGGNLASQWIRSDDPTTPKAPNALFIGGLPSGADLRGILAFGLASFKAGDVVSDVTVSLYHGTNDASDHTDGSINSSSLELSLITNAAYANNRASWDNADQDTPVAWNTAGGDAGAPLVTITGLDLTQLDTDDEVTFHSAALTAAVQAAVDAGHSQISFLVRSPDLEATETRNFFVFQGGIGLGSGSSIGPNLHIELAP